MEATGLTGNKESKEEVWNGGTSTVFDARERKKKSP
jgi:hypothetical protein